MLPVFFNLSQVSAKLELLLLSISKGFLKFDNWTQKSDASLEVFLINFIKLLISVAAIYFLGILWLSKFVGWDKVLLFGLKPFWLAELFKILSLSFLIPTILKLKKII